jgi:hypothetical protein
MFEHEPGQGRIAGGLLALDQALGGQLTRLRAAGAFRTQSMETRLAASWPPGWCRPAPARRTKPSRVTALSTWAPRAQAAGLAFAAAFARLTTQALPGSPGG